MRSKCILPGLFCLFSCFSLPFGVSLWSNCTVLDKFCSLYKTVEASLNTILKENSLLNSVNWILFPFFILNVATAEDLYGIV